MRLRIGTIGERLLGLFVPRVTAQAACTPYEYYRNCGCYYNYTQQRYETHWRYCYVSSSCHTTCDDICGHYSVGC